MWICSAAHLWKVNMSGLNPNKASYRHDTSSAKTACLISGQVPVWRAGPWPSSGNNEPGNVWGLELWHPHRSEVLIAALDVLNWQIHVTGQWTVHLAPGSWNICSRVGVGQISCFVSFCFRFVKLDEIGQLSLCSPARGELLKSTEQGPNNHRRFISMG